MRRESLIACLLFLAAFLFALPGLNPTFYADDSPETVTAGVLMGIPHPPGYPLYTMASRLLTFLPVSHYPFRVNLLSALIASLVVVVLFLAARRVWKAPLPVAAVIAFFWIAGRSAYPAALSAKGGIYHLTALLLAGILFSLLKRRFLLAAFLYGLGLGNHWMSMAAYAPGFLLLGYAVSRDAPFEKKEAPALAALVLLGLSVYLYLPLRAALSPDLDWGDPVTWGGFKFNFFRAQYTQGESAWKPIVWLKQWFEYLKIAFLEFPGLLLFAAAGATLSWRREPWPAKGLLLAWGSIVAAIGVYLNVEADKYYLIRSYALSSHVFLAAFTAWLAGWWTRREPEAAVVPPEAPGTAPVHAPEAAPAPPEAPGNAAPAVPTPLHSRWGREQTALLLLLLLLIPSAVLRVTRQRQDRFTFSWDYLLNVWHGIPAHSLFYARGDSIVFPSWYFQWAEGKRSDLAVIGVDGLPMKWVRVHLQRKHPDLKVPFPEAQVPLVGNESIAPMTRFLYFSNPSLPKYFSYNKITDASLPEVRLVPQGLAYQGVVPPLGVKSPPVDAAFLLPLWDSLRFRNLADHGKGQDERTRMTLLKDYAVIRNGLGVYYEDMADEVKEAAERAKKPAPPKVLEYLYQQCYVHFLWAQEWYPDDHEFQFNIGNSLFNLGRYGEAAGYYGRSVKLDPKYADAYYNWGVAEYQMAHFQKAGELFDEVLKLNPGKKEAEEAIQYMTFNGLYKRR